MPEKFTFPFCYQPHPAAKMAAEELQQYLRGKAEWQEELQKGKMFGVLVVEGGALWAYSGLLAGRNDHEGFVPSVFDSQDYNGHFKTEERRISALSRGGRATRQYSINLQRWLFTKYNMLNAEGESCNLLDIFSNYYSGSKAYEKKAGGVPPAGTGDCCAPKLLQYAYQHNLKPLCMAEFWYGDSPKGETRHHLKYYPACSGKCKPTLSFMLKGLNVEDNPQETAIQGKLSVVYEDDYLIAINKPAGMPSVPGKVDVEDAIHALREIKGEELNESDFLKPVHRLDMATSGLLLIAKTEDVFRTMQAKFGRREVHKEYVAIVESSSDEPPKEGTVISLPLAPDFLNRPYQKVDYDEGKEAVTIVGPHPNLHILRCNQHRTSLLKGGLNNDSSQGEVNADVNKGQRLLLIPLTGRTHQLRVHCAHKDGLNAPIVGDELYGNAADRLYLHCQSMSFTHPITNEKVNLFIKAEF